MAEGLYTLDADGLVTYVNAAASRMLGWNEEELHGKPMHETIHFQDADHNPIPAEACSLLEVRMLGRTLRSSDATFTRKDGTTFPVAFSSAPLPSEKTIEGVVVVFRDVTEEKGRRSRSGANWLNSAGSDGFVTPWTRTAWFCIHNLLCRSSAPTLRRSYWCAWWTVPARSSPRASSYPQRRNMG